MLDIFKIHDIGAFQLRTSNYGCLGSDDDVVPQWPSLEFPKGSGIDYLFIGSIWFGAKKQRRNEYGEMLFWQDEEHSEMGTTNMGFGRVIDTLTTVGFDGDADMYELLPAYNPLEENALGAQYYQYNSSDSTLKFYYSDGIPDYDDDGDGRLTERIMLLQLTPSLNIAPSDSAVIMAYIFLGSSCENMLEIAQYIEDSLEVAVEDENLQLYETDIQLQNYPNPMKSSTTISFSLHRRDTKNAEIKIYNIKGQLIKTLECINRVNAKDTNSLHSIFWDGKDKNNKPVSSGIYFYRLETENYQSSVKKLLLLR